MKTINRSKFKSRSALRFKRKGLGFANGPSAGPMESAPRAYGVDGVQALRLTLEMIGAELYSSRYHSSGNLYFETLHRGYGFPVPANMRDVLIGDDKSLF